MTGGLGRRTPTDFSHVTQYPLRLVQPETVTVAERRLDLPTQYVAWYDQGSEGACVGFSLSWMMSILNRRKYVARKLYKAAQDVDEWSDTPPEEGTSVRAGCKILLTQGHWRFFRGVEKALGFMEGISHVRWATTVDEVRTSIQNGIPVVNGINWYEAFDRPVQIRGRYGHMEWWIGVDDKGIVQRDLGRLRGGHAIATYQVSDARQAVKYVNTWGDAYPRVFVPYEVQERLLREYGECCLVTDR